jgi:hypothetical protein
MSIYRLTKQGEPDREIIAGEQFVIDNFPDWSYELVPPKPKPTHKTEFSPKELYNSFTAEEIILAKVSSDPSIAAQAQLLAEGRDVVINSTDASYQSTVDQFEASGVITADRAVEYRQGLPLENV